MIRSFHPYAVILLVIISMGVAMAGCTSSTPAALTPASSPTPVPTMTTASSPGTTMTMVLPSASAPIPSGSIPSGSPTTDVPASSVGGQTVPVTLTAENFLFDQTTITVPAGSTVVMTFINKDATIPHNFGLYSDSTAAKKIFSGDIITGPATVTYTFTAPAVPGKYFFRCDVHPTVMFGTFVVT
jgi:plastocyanin